MGMAASVGSGPYGSLDHHPALVGTALSELIAGAVRWSARDVSLTSLSTLSTLSRTGPRRITDLAVVEGVAQPSMTSLVNALERSGLVERHRDPGDRRVVLIVLTAAGADLLRTRRVANAERFTQLIGKLPRAEAAALTAALPALEQLRALDDAQRDPGNGNGTGA